MTNELEITYAAHTAGCTFLLDAEGVCRRIVMTPGAPRRDVAKTAARCVGAQYVASLDASVPGCLVESPKVGVPLLFARVDEHGRISLVRTGNLVAFETRNDDDAHAPFPDSVGVMTSAPRTDQLVRRRPKSTRVAAAAPAHEAGGSDAPPATVRDPYADPSLARTAEVHAAPSSARRGTKNLRDRPR